MPRAAAAPGCDNVDGQRELVELEEPESLVGLLGCDLDELPVVARLVQWQLEHTMHGLAPHR
jgi:hypothetical protein